MELAISFENTVAHSTTKRRLCVEHVPNSLALSCPVDRVSTPTARPPAEVLLLQHSRVEREITVRAVHLLRLGPELSVQCQGRSLHYEVDHRSPQQPSPHSLGSKLDIFCTQVFLVCYAVQFHDGTADFFFCLIIAIVPMIMPTPDLN